MRIVLMVCAIVFIIAAASAAQPLPPQPYVGLYADAAHSVMSVYNPGGFTPFELWVWWLPSEHGLKAMEFKLTHPASVIVSTITRNPELEIIIDECIGYFCPVFQSCHVDWVWSHRLACYLTSTAPGFIEVGAPPYSSVIQAASCEPGYPLEEVTILNHLALNQGGEIAVAPRSWGAIRDLYR